MKEEESMKDIRVLLVGVGGYGAGYVREMLEHGVEKHALIAGVVDPYAASSPAYQALKDANVCFYDTVQDFYALELSSQVQHGIIENFRG